MQGSSVQQDIESGVKSTSTPEMMKLVAVSAAAAVVQAIVLLGWVTLKIGNDIFSVSFMSLDPPITSIIFFAALFTIPTALATPVMMFTHWKPAAVLFGSQQLTDSLRGQCAAPFRMKYLYAVQAFINGLCLISLKYKFFWPAALNMVNIGLYLAGLVLVIQHFERPDVPTDLASTAGSMMGGTVDVGRLDALEREMKTLKQELQELKAGLNPKQAATEMVNTKQAATEIVAAEAPKAPSQPTPRMWGTIFGGVHFSERAAVQQIKIPSEE